MEDKCNCAVIWAFFGIAFLWDWYFILFLFYFIFKLYIIVLVLPNIKMIPPQVYMCSLSWTLLPPKHRILKQAKLIGHWFRWKPFFQSLFRWNLKKLKMWGMYVTRWLKILVRKWLTKAHRQYSSLVGERIHTHNLICIILLQYRRNKLRSEDQTSRTVYCEYKSADNLRGLAPPKLNIG